MKFFPAVAAALLAATSPAWAAPAHPKVKAAAARHVALPTTVVPDR